MKKALKSLDNFMRCALFGASLASPVIGAGIGFFVGGLAGAGIGLLAGPAGAVVALCVYTGAFEAAGGVKKLIDAKRAGKSLNLKQKLSRKNLVRFGRNVAANMVQGLDWALNMTLAVCTLGNASVDLHGVADRIRYGSQSQSQSQSQPDTAPRHAATVKKHSKLTGRSAGGAFDGAGRKPTPEQNNASKQKNTKRHGHGL